MYYFIPRNYEKFEIYKKFWSVKDIFEVNSTGIVTSQDEFIIEQNKKDLLEKLDRFRKSPADIKYLEDTFKANNNACNGILEGHKYLNTLENLEDEVKQINYRPFDTRWTCYSSKLIHRNRNNVMQHFLNKENLGLITTRQVKSGKTWQHAFVSNTLSESCLVSSQTGEIGYTFPLYTYNTAKTDKGSQEELAFEKAEKSNQQKIAKLKSILEKLKK